MTTKASRKDAIARYKQRELARGVFSVRCVPTGRVWVGASPNLEAARNSTWFMLRSDSHRARDLQEDWNAHGEGAFRFDVLETLEPDLLPMAVADALKAKKRQWAERLSAPALL